MLAVYTYILEAGKAEKAEKVEKPCAVERRHSTCSASTCTYREVKARYVNVRFCVCVSSRLVVFLCVLY